jgi:uncharacterized coiled-coil protein SlyX
VATSQDGYKSVQYQNLVAPLIEAVQEQQNQIDQQQAQINELIKEIQTLKANSK